MKTNFLKGALALTIVFSAAFTANTLEEKKIDIKESTVEWKGEKVTGSHYGKINFKVSTLKVIEGM